MSQKEVAHCVYLRLTANVFHWHLDRRGVDAVLGHLFVTIAKLRSTHRLTIFNRASTELRSPVVCFNGHICSIKKPAEAGYIIQYWSAEKPPLSGFSYSI